MARVSVLVMLAACACGQVDELGLAVSVVDSEISSAFEREGVSTGDEIEVTIGVGLTPAGVAGRTVIFGSKASIVVSESGVAAHVIAHELGHAMGLEHDDDPMSIMFSEAPSITAATAAEQLARLCSVNHCRALVLPVR